jgi:hypothetical protein
MKISCMCTFNVSPGFFPSDYLLLSLSLYLDLLSFLFVSFPLSLFFLTYLYASPLYLSSYVSLPFLSSLSPTLCLLIFNRDYQTITRQSR